MNKAEELQENKHQGLRSPIVTDHIPGEDAWDLDQDSSSNNNNNNSKPSSNLHVGSGNNTSLTANSKLTNIESIVCGGTAGLFSRMIIAPLDILKIRLQLQVHPVGAEAPKGTRLFHQVTKILRTEGITAFWKGNIPAEIMYVLYGATQFTTYSLMSKAITDGIPGTPDGTVTFVSGASSGLVATTLTYPFDLLRTRFAASSTRIYTSLPQAIHSIYVNESFSGYFRGLGPALVSVVPYMGLMFTSYKQARSFLEYIAPTQTGPGVKFTEVHPFFISHEAIAGFCAGIVSKGAVFPLDLIRKRLQVQGPKRAQFLGGQIPIYPRNSIACALDIARKEGLPGFYRGFFVSLLKSAPTSAITMWTFENSLWLMRALRSEGYINY